MIKREKVKLKKSNSIEISFEFFPPKTVDNMRELCQTAINLNKYQPDFFSVTFGAGGSTRDGTLETIQTLQTKMLNMAPHLACLGASKAELRSILEQYQALGIKRLVALRGDLPLGVVCAGELQYASELVDFIRKTTGDVFHLAVAAYPEIHPQAQSVKDDIENLKRKYEAGASSAITQYFFNPDAYFYYVDDCRKIGIPLPIIPGIMPITQFHKLARFSDNCGAEIPRFIRKRLESYGDDIDAIKQFGLEVVYDLCQRLIAGGAPGLHFYTLNKARAVSDLLDLLMGAQLGLVKNL